MGGGGGAPRPPLPGAAGAGGRRWSRAVSLGVRCGCAGPCWSRSVGSRRCGAGSVRGGSRCGGSVVGVPVGCCARCGRASAAAGGSGALVPVPAGVGFGRVPGPRGPAGWRGAWSSRRVRFERVERVCGPCLGVVAPVPVPASPGLAAAAGFRRFGPPPERFGVRLR